MNWDAVGAVAEAVGAVTVIVTLFLLLRQLRVSNEQARQANDLARADSQRDILKQVADHATLAMNDAGLQEQIRACYREWESAAPAAKWAFESWASAYFYIVEQAVYMHDEGLLSDETYDAMEAAALRIIATPGGGQWWSRKSRHIGATLARRLEARREAVGGAVQPMLGLSDPAVGAKA